MNLYHVHAVGSDGAHVYTVTADSVAEARRLTRDRMAHDGETPDVRGVDTLGRVARGRIFPAGPYSHGMVLRVG